MNAPDSAPDFGRSYLEYLLGGEIGKASALIEDAMNAGMSLRELYLEVFQPAQRDLGDRWQRGEVSVAQEHFCTAATQRMMAQVFPRTAMQPKRYGTAVVTCVSGDLHEVGARFIADLLEIEGWRTHYLGADVPTASVVETLGRVDADLLALSVTIPAHLDRLRELTTAVRAECPSVQLMIGGRAFPDGVAWREFGVDGFAMDAAGAIETAADLWQELRVAGPPPGSTASSHEPSKGLPTAIDTIRAQDAPPGPAEQQREVLEPLARLNNELSTLHRELARRNADLAALTRQKDEILGIAAHDLRGPLTLVSMQAQLVLELATDRLTEQEKNALGSIRRQTRRLGSIVGDLLDVTRSEFGGIILRPETIDIEQWLLEVGEQLQPLATAKSIELRMAIEPGLGQLQADAGKLEQVLVNLVDNALKYSDPETVVEVSVSASDAAVIFRVADQGQGIANEKFAELFQPFAQIGSVPTRGETSVGLGLAVVARFVEAFGGTIDVSSKLGEGTTFTVTIPRSA